LMEKFAADLQMTQHEEDADDCQDLFSALQWVIVKMRDIWYLRNVIPWFLTCC
jgi:hypothetical protein